MLVPPATGTTRSGWQSRSEQKKVINQLIACLRDTRRLIITEQTAEETIRLSFSQGGVLDVTGTDAQTGQPRTVALWYEEVWRAIRD
jgi:actin-like ATPase involved in cell morphogenesis